MSGLWALKVIGVELSTGMVRVRESGCFLKRFNVAAHDGRDPFPVTRDVREAATFETPTDALDFWRTASISHPRRPDGGVNRPLTALTVEIVLASDGARPVAAATPSHWMNETSGELRPAVEAYLLNEAMTHRQIAAMRGYLRQWIRDDRWKGPMIDVLRTQVEEITRREDIERWLARAVDVGIDPL